MVFATMAVTLSGLYRYRQRLGGTSNIWDTLYQHGLLWLSMAMFAGVPNIVSNLLWFIRCVLTSCRFFSL
jgi:hypothetical protein